MKVIVILMIMCSTTAGNNCKVIDTPQVEFEDMYNCTVYGYSYSEEIISELSPEFVNKYGAYTKFSCESKKIV
jgi:hypothetical protein